MYVYVISNLIRKRMFDQFDWLLRNINLNWNLSHTLSNSHSYESLSLMLRSLTSDEKLRLRLTFVKFMRFSQWLSFVLYVLIQKCHCLHHCMSFIFYQLARISLSSKLIVLVTYLASLALVALIYAILFNLSWLFNARLELS